MESTEHDLLLPLVKEENICLPLAVNVVCQYWNTNLPMSEAIEISKKYPTINGSILIEGIELAERHGLRSLILHSTLQELKKIIDMGIPPIVILPGIHDTIQHASVLSGYDDKEKTIFHYIPQPDSTGEFQVGVIPEQKFEKLWSEDDQILILIAPLEIISKLSLKNQPLQKSNRLCFEAEKLNILKYTQNAIDSLKKAIEIDPNNAIAYSLMGAILNEQNSAECIKYYEQSLALNNRLYLSWRGLGNYFLKTKQFSKAEYYYTKAIQLNPTRYGPIYKNRGITRLQQNKKLQAKEDFGNYLQYHPKAFDKESIRQAIKELNAECGI